MPPAYVGSCWSILLTLSLLFSHYYTWMYSVLQLTFLCKILMADAIMLACLVGWSDIWKQDCMRQTLWHQPAKLDEHSRVYNSVAVAPSLFIVMASLAPPLSCKEAAPPTLFRSLWSLLSLKHGEINTTTHCAWGWWGWEFHGNLVLLSSLSLTSSLCFVLWPISHTDQLSLSLRFHLVWIDFIWSFLVLKDVTWSLPIPVLGSPT